MIEGGEPERRVSVLFVDDEPDVLRSIARALESAPFEVLTVPGPGEALGLLETRRVDVLVADIDMPEMTGLELSQIARRDHPQMVRMLLTGNASLEKAVHAINEGEVLRFFMKPFDAHLFVAAVEVLSERIGKLRHDGETDARKNRRRDLYAWLDGRFPGTTSFERNREGEILVDALSLIRTIDEAGSPPLRDLLRREG